MAQSDLSLQEIDEQKREDDGEGDGEQNHEDDDEGNGIDDEEVEILDKQVKKNNVNGGEKEVVKEANCIPKGNWKKDVVGKEKIHMTIMDDLVDVDTGDWATLMASQDFIEGCSQQPTWSQSS
ncbi:hypothetical protein Sjap_005126 [Stephania japonica]|uniref:Uncharacterized protein n=1 Tax=Stephania japonica TaxID=461633 RepID=A0AAP0PHK9_9MAGN